MKSASKITLIYFIISFFWILFSDRFIKTLSDSPIVITQLQTYKGWFFVISTSIFLYLLISREIRRQAELNEALKKAKEKAEESDRLKSAFLSNMSHEIRTPLNGIIGFSQLLFEDEDDEDTRQMYIGQVNQNSEMLLRIINNILEISQIQENMIVPNFKKVVISELIENIGRTYHSPKSLLTQKGLDFEMTIDARCLKTELHTDPDRLTQILYNLLDNAVKYTSTGKIKLGCSVEKDFLRIFVKDTGIGIPNEILPLIFDRFKRFQKSEEFSGGFGLGLSISRGLANALNAKIEVTSIQGEGSCFAVLLPLDYNLKSHMGEQLSLAK